MIKGQKVKIISLVNEPPLKLNQVYEGEYYSYHSQALLLHTFYEGFTLTIDGEYHHLGIKNFEILAEHRDKLIDEILNNNK